MLGVEGLLSRSEAHYPPGCHRSPETEAMELILTLGNPVLTVGRLPLSSDKLVALLVVSSAWIWGVACGPLSFWGGGP